MADVFNSNQEEFDKQIKIDTHEDRLTGVLFHKAVRIYDPESQEKKDPYEAAREAAMN